MKSFNREPFLVFFIVFVAHPTFLISSLLTIRRVSLISSGLIQFGSNDRANNLHRGSIGHIRGVLHRLSHLLYPKQSVVCSPTSKHDECQPRLHDIWSESETRQDHVRLGDGSCGLRCDIANSLLSLSLKVHTLRASGNSRPLSSPLTLRSMSSRLNRTSAAQPERLKYEFMLAPSSYIGKGP